MPRPRSQQVIDVVYHGGDVFWGWTFTGLSQVIGIGIAGIAIAGAMIASIWGIMGFCLGRHTRQKDQEDLQTEN